MAIFAKKRKPPAPPQTLEELETENSRLIGECGRLTQLRTELIQSGDTSGQVGRIEARAADLAAGGSGVATLDDGSTAERLAACNVALERNENARRGLQSPLASARWSATFEGRHFAARQKLAHAVVALLESFEEVRAIIAEARAAGAVQPCGGTSMIPLANFSSCAAMGAALRAMRPTAPKQFVRDNANLLRD
jgi:hypothetical protein